MSREERQARYLRESRPAGAVTCPACHGMRRDELLPSGRKVPVYCETCRGNLWVLPDR